MDDRLRSRLIGGVRGFLPGCVFRPAEALAKEGLALPVPGSIAAQTVCGVVATGTHGTGIGIGNLSSFVLGMRIVDGTGRIRSFPSRMARTSGTPASTSVHWGSSMCGSGWCRHSVSAAAGFCRSRPPWRPSPTCWRRMPTWGSGGCRDR